MYYLPMSSVFFFLGIDPFDKDINVNWPIVDGVIVSERDRSHKSFAEHRSS